MMDNLQKGSGIEKIPVLHGTLTASSSTCVLSKSTLHGNTVDPSPQVDVEIPCSWIECIYHVASSHDMDSIFRSGLIAGGTNRTERRQTMFFTAVDLVNESQKDQTILT